MSCCRELESIVRGPSSLSST